MKQEQFEQAVLQFIRRKPFEPFIVELLDGQVLEIPSSRVIVGGGGATHIGPDFEMVDFVCEEVRAIHEAESVMVPILRTSSPRDI